MAEVINMMIPQKFTEDIERVRECLVESWELKVKDWTNENAKVSRDVYRK